MWDAILEALLDSLKTLPILLVVYILIEFMEHKSEIKFERLVASTKNFGPLWGAGLGVIPQCGFSAVMADLFSKKMITIGTLFSVFIATSDEAFAILLSKPNYISSVAILVVTKLILAIIFGYLIDLIFKKQQLRADTLEHNVHFEHEKTHSHTEEQKKEENLSVADVCSTCTIEEKTCSTCEHNMLHHHHEFESEKVEKKSVLFWHIILQGLLHTLEIFGFILIANILISVLFEVSGGTEFLTALMGKNAWYQPLVCSLIGLIPNCAGSVVLVEFYVNGIISFSSCLGGLCTAAGIGLLILFKNNKNIKQNLLILLGLFGIGVFVGFIFNLFLPFAISI